MQSAVLAIVNPSVCLSICHTLALCQNNSSYDHVAFTGGFWIIIIILRQFLTRRNTTKVITRARINAKGDDMSQRKKISYERSVVRRYDFNATLKLSIDCLVRMRCGGRFHSDGAATANDRAPNFVARWQSWR